MHVTHAIDLPGPEATYPLHSRAVSRHAIWARDFAAAGDIAAAHDELLDIAAIAAEVGDLASTGGESPR